MTKVETKRIKEDSEELEAEEFEVHKNKGDKKKDGKTKQKG